MVAIVTMEGSFDLFTKISLLIASMFYYVFCLTIGTHERNKTKQ